MPHESHLKVNVPSRATAHAATKGSKSLPAVPVLQQKPKDQEAQLQKTEGHTITTTGDKSSPAVPVLKHKSGEEVEMPVQMMESAAATKHNMFSPQHTLQAFGIGSQKLVQGPATLTPVIQYVLDADTGIVPDTERESLSKMLEASGYDSAKLQKITAKKENEENLAAKFVKLLEKDLQLRGELTNKSKADSAKKRKKRIKDQLQDLYGRILTFAEIKLDEAEATYDAAIRAGINVVKTYKARTDRKGDEEGKREIAANTRLVKYEREHVLPDLIKVHYVDIGWVTAENFRKTILETYSQEAGAVTAIPAKVRSAAETEKGFVNTQLTAWNTVAANARGVNENGTWGTSSTGVSTFTVRTVTPAVWNILRKWWIAKANAFVTPSDTSTHSLKMDRGVPDTALSGRFNYHIDVSA